MSPVEIKLTGKHAKTLGVNAFVDQIDADRVLKHSWFLRKIVSGSGSYFYAAAKINGKEIFLHRFILGAVAGQLVDHRNHDTLNCQRDNVRICTHGQNMQNRKVMSSNKLGIKGVYFSRDKRFVAEIKVAKKRINLGRFKTVEEAARAYQEAAVKYHGEFANFG